MIPLTQRSKLRLVGAAYAVVVALSVMLVLLRYLQYKLHPDDADAYGGMWAGGDMILAILIAGMLLVPTFFLILVLRKDEPGYNKYSKALIGVALTSPLAIALTALPTGPWWIGVISFSRLLVTPFAIVLYVVSWIATRFRGARRRIVYGLLIEVGTIVVSIALLMGRSFAP
jgi:asparagine N-glycosylation enzyme membrane subunit Stt3